MIRACIFRNRKQEIWGFEIEGHSGYAEAGSDIICAAVSALAINTANCLESLAGVKPEVTSSEGFLSCEVSDIRREEKSWDKAGLLFLSLEQGLQSIAETYGKKYLTVSTYQKA